MDRDQKFGYIVQSFGIVVPPTDVQIVDLFILFRILGLSLSLSLSLSISLWLARVRVCGSASSTSVER